MPKKVAVVHHSILSHRGGGDLVCAWLLDSLKDDFELTFITFGKKIDWAEVDRFYGTSIGKKPIRVVYHPILQTLGLENRPYRLIIALLERYLKKVSGDYDLMLSTYNELDMGRPGVQYIHGPSRSDSGAKLYLLKYHKSFLRKWYHDFCDWYSGFNPENVKKNYTLVNSNWTSTVVQETFGKLETETVYPPVFLIARPQPWEQKKNEFLCIGDLLPEKKTHQAIDVIARLRERGHDVTLKIIGDTPGEYADFVKSYAKKFPFVTHMGRLNRGRVSELIASTRYMIHMRDYEGFGIAIAEMVTGGSIPFAPNRGGQVEVMARDANILFEDFNDAVEKIDRMLKSPDLQQSVLKHLSEVKGQFSADHFKKQLVEIVRRRSAL